MSSALMIWKLRVVKDDGKKDWWLIIDGPCDCVTSVDIWLRPLPVWQFQVPSIVWLRRQAISINYEDDEKNHAYRVSTTEDLLAVLLLNIFWPWEIRVWDHHDINLIEVVLFDSDSDWPLCKICYGQFWYDETLDPVTVYQANARVLSQAIQRIGMGKYQVSCRINYAFFDRFGFC